MLNIIYEDADIIVSVKPSGISSQAESNGSKGYDSLLSEYRKSENESDYIGIIHRLDRATSGIMVYAKNEKSAAILSKQVSERLFKKKYYAVVYGIPDNDSGSMTDYFAKDRITSKSIIVDKKRIDAKLASLRYKLIETSDFCGIPISLIEVELKTGRMHQIRLQFSSRGMPLIGDAKYGKDTSYDLALFAYALSFNHPTTKKSLSFYASPADILPWTEFKYNYKKAAD